MTLPSPYAPGEAPPVLVGAARSSPTPRPTWPSWRPMAGSWDASGCTSGRAASGRPPCSRRCVRRRCGRERSSGGSPPGATRAWSPRWSLPWCGRWTTSASTSGAASAAFGDFVSLAALAARDRGSAGLPMRYAFGHQVKEGQAVTLDGEDLRTLAYAWQELQQASPEPAAVVIAAGLPNTPDVLTAAVTFSERFAFRTLERLAEADAVEVLEAPAREQGVTWAPGLLAEVVALAQGYPYFLQLYGDAVWREAAPAAGAQLGPGLLGRARTRVEAELTTMFRARWVKATPGEQRVLTGMAELAGIADTDVRRGALADHLGLTSNDLSVPRRGLLDKGLIEVAGRGALRFTVPGFAAWVRQETGG